MLEKASQQKEQYCFYMLCIVYNLILLIQFIEYGIRQVLEEVAFYYDTELNSADLAILREELTTAYLIASMEICPYQRCDDNLSLISMILHEVIFNRHYIEWYSILVISTLFISLAYRIVEQWCHRQLLQLIIFGMGLLLSAI